MTTILDVVTRAASDPAFASRFAGDPLDAAHALGMRIRGRADAHYLEARLAALARPLEREPAPHEVDETAAEMRADLGLEPRDAAREAARALFFLRDYRFHQRLLNGAPPGELTALMNRIQSEGPRPGPHDRGTLLCTLHYGPFPLLWLWLKLAHVRNGLPRSTILYDTDQYRPDVSAEQYGKLAAAGAVPPRRSDLDLGTIGARPALREAVARLRSGETVLMLPDAVPVAAGERSLVGRVGRLEVAYPRGAAWIAERSGATVRGAVIRPTGDGHVVWWAAPRPGPVTHAVVAEALQELLDRSVARDPAPWLAWYTQDDQPDAVRTS